MSSSTLFAQIRTLLLAATALLSSSAFQLLSSVRSEGPNDIIIRPKEIFTVRISVYKALLPLCTATLVLAQSGSISSDQLSQMRYRYIGPVGNRVIAAASVPGDPDVYYAGSASGGIFKSTDGGTQWAPVFDSQPVSSVGSLAIAASDRNEIGRASW